MTDRIKGFTVILDRDVREDDFEIYMDALRLMKGVQQVIPHVSGVEDTIADERATHKIKIKLYDFIKDL